MWIYEEEEKWKKKKKKYPLEVQLEKLKKNGIEKVLDNLFTYEIENA